MLDDGESQARAASPTSAGAIHFVKSLENARQRFTGNARAGIGDRQRDPLCDWFCHASEMRGNVRTRAELTIHERTQQNTGTLADDAAILEETA